MGLSEVENSSGSVDDGSEHVEGLLSRLPGTGFGGGVDDIWEVAVREGKSTHISHVEGKGWIGSKMWALYSEGDRVASENGGSGIEAEPSVDVGKAFEQPTAEEASASCNEDAFVSSFIPERSRLAEDMVEIDGGQKLLCHRLV